MKILATLKLDEKTNDKRRGSKMNIAMNSTKTSNLHDLDRFITSEINLIDEQQKQCQLALTDYAVNFLDKVFPLTNGSHQQVASYVVYYHHLLAFFPDGSQSGLVDTKQFKGLCGHKEQPDALLLQADGRYVEVTFHRQGDSNKAMPAHIDDIQIEANEQDTENGRQWFSMLKLNRDMMLATPTCHQDFKPEGKSFTSTSGDEITL